VNAAPGTAVDIALRVVAGLVALLAGAGAAVVECFLVPLRVDSVRVPIAPVLAVVMNVAVVVYGRWGTGSPLGGAVPALGWFGVIAALSRRTDDGDLVLYGDWVGLALLLTGTLALLAAMLLPLRIPARPGAGYAQPGHAQAGHPQGGHPQEHRSPQEHRHPQEHRLPQ